MYSQRAWFHLFVVDGNQRAGLYFPKMLCRLLGVTESTLPYVRLSSTIAPFIFSFVISYNLELLLATDGFPGPPPAARVILNILLTIGTIFKLNWGIVGAGLATSFLRRS